MRSAMATGRPLSMAMIRMTLSLRRRALCFGLLACALLIGALSLSGVARAAELDEAHQQKLLAMLEKNGFSGEFNAMQGAMLGIPTRGTPISVRKLQIYGKDNLTLSSFSAGWGCLAIAVPVLLLGRLHQGPATVGYLWGVMGAAGIVSALLTGRIRMAGRERRLMVASVLACGVAMAALPLAGSVVVVAVAMFAIGFVNGPFDVALFTLRQRRTDPARFGRVFAVSMSLNMVGGPIGSATAGPLIGWSLDAALWAAVVVTLLAAIFPIATIPAKDEPPNLGAERLAVGQQEDREQTADRVQHDADDAADQLTPPDGLDPIEQPDQRQHVKDEIEEERRHDRRYTDEA